MISEKKIRRRMISGEKLLARKYLAKKILHRKKISLIWHIMLEKSYTVECQENKLYYQDPVPERLISFNRGLKILFHFLYLLSSSLLRKTFCVIITESRGKTQLVCKLEGHVLRQENLA